MPASYRRYADGDQHGDGDENGSDGSLGCVDVHPRAGEHADRQSVQRISAQQKGQGDVTQRGDEGDHHAGHDSGQDERNRNRSEGIHGIGEVAELLTQRFNSLEDLAGATVEDLTEIPGIGPKIAESINDYFQVPANREVIQLLERAGVKLRQEPGLGLAATELADLPWGGLTFVITGTLSSMTRREAESRVKALGGSATSSVTGKTNYLVAGESAGSKLATANRLGTPVLSEPEFLQLLEEPQTTATE